MLSIQSPLAAILIIVFAVLLFLALREVVCWYYKINKLVDLQTQQNELLQQIRDKLFEWDVVEKS
jgi:hypothetical protein